MASCGCVGCAGRRPRGAGTVVAGPAVGRAVEPEMDLARADGVLVLPVLPGPGDTRPLAQRARHHQVVEELGLGLELPELVHGVEDLVVPALLEPGDPLLVGLPRFGREDVHRIAGLVVTQFAQRPEGVGEGAGGDEQDPSPGGGGDAVGERPPQPQMVLHVPGLADPDGHPPFVGQAFAEELPEVDGGVVDRQELVLDRGDPGAVLVRELLDVPGEFGIAGEVVRHPAHPARQLLGGEETGAAGLRGDHELDGRRPVRVEHDDGVVRVGGLALEDVLAEPAQAGDEGDLLAVVELQPVGLRQDDGGHVREESRPDDLTHGCSIRSVRSRCSSDRSRSRSSRCRPPGRPRTDGNRRRAPADRVRRSSSPTPCPRPAVR